MPDVICNTSPLQYLHQIGHLELLPKLASRIIVPTAVAEELAEGRRRGLDLPMPEELPWVDLRAPSSEKVVRLVADLGPGETGVLLLALERTNPVVILDDALARRHAEVLGIALTGTLGILLDAKRRGLVPAVTPLVDDLQHLGFRLSEATRNAVLRRAGEPEPTRAAIPVAGTETWPTPSAMSATPRSARASRRDRLSIDNALSRMDRNTAVQIIQDLREFQGATVVTLRLNYSMPHSPCTGDIPISSRDWSIASPSSPCAGWA